MSRLDSSLAPVCGSSELMCHPDPEGADSRAEGKSLLMLLGVVFFFFNDVGIFVLVMSLQEQIEEGEKVQPCFFKLVVFGVELCLKLLLYVDLDRDGFSVLRSRLDLNITTIFFQH